MILLDITTKFANAIQSLALDPEMSFIQGTTSLHTLLADNVDTYPCLFLQSPRGGTARIQKSGTVLVGYKITFAILEPMALDDTADNIREKIDELGWYALKVYRHVMSSVQFREEAEARFTEVSGVFDSHLTGMMIEFTLYDELTNFGC